MKKTFVLAALTLLTASVSAHGVERGKAEVEIQGKHLSIDYGRPQLHGRDMLSKAADGMVWRMGADTATTLTTQADLVVGKVRIPKGSYSLWARKITGDRWELVVNSETGIWGTQHKAEHDLVSIPLETTTTEKSVETFTIQLEDQGSGRGLFSMSWGTVRLSTAFKVE